MFFFCQKTPGKNARKAATKNIWCFTPPPPLCDTSLRPVSHRCKTVLFIGSLLGQKYSDFTFLNVLLNWAPYKTLWSKRSSVEPRVLWIDYGFGKPVSCRVHTVYWLVSLASTRKCNTMKRGFIKHYSRGTERSSAVECSGIAIWWVKSAAKPRRNTCWFQLDGLIFVWIFRLVLKPIFHVCGSIDLLFSEFADWERNITNDRSILSMSHADTGEARGEDPAKPTPLSQLTESLDFCD